MTMSDSKEPLRLAILGAGRIPPSAIIRPARLVPGVEIMGVASRRLSRAEKFARKHKVPRVYASGEELLADEEIDAVYISLPNHLHAYWATQALRAGKHVLCEKPLACNVIEAKAVVAEAKRSGRVLLEGYHYSFHPMAQRIREIVRGGEIGTLERMETRLCLPAFLFISSKDFRYQYEMGGGVTMDLGCYGIHLMRFVSGLEPEVVSAEAKVKNQVDLAMRAGLSFSGDSGSCLGQMDCSFSSFIPEFSACFYGSRGTVKAINPYAPQDMSNSLKVQNDKGTHERKFSREVSSFVYQLRYFVQAIEGVGEKSFDLRHDDIIGNMRAIDGIYEKAGLPKREGKSIL